MNVLDLFSGIGGFSLGLERAGMQTVAFCEIEPYCRAVLKKHWPEVPCYDDIKTLTAAKLATDGIQADIIAGGFPCQDISTAGKRQGIEGKRSGLWKEFYRLICEIRPRYAIVENVAALRSNGLSVVLSDLATLGYDAEWHCIPASAVGAPHRRDRIWILAHSQSTELKRKWSKQDREQNGFADSSKDVAYTSSIGCARPRLFTEWGGAETDGSRQATNAFSGGIGNQWSIEPDVGRVANGIPARVDRLKALGNAVVPQIPEIIGKAIMAEDFK